MIERHHLRSFLLCVEPGRARADRVNDVARGKMAVVLLDQCYDLREYGTTLSARVGSPRLNNDGRTSASE